MRIPTILDRFLLLAACLRRPLPASAQEHPARRVANIVSVAVEEYGKAVDDQGRLISAQEYQEANDFLVDAKRAADRLSGANAAPARALLDSIAAAVAAKRPPADGRLARDSASPRLLGNEAKLELPARRARPGRGEGDLRAELRELSRRDRAGRRAGRRGR